MQLRQVRPLLAAVKYRALDVGEVDVVDGYSTDGLIARYDLVVLADDRRFFPPYEAAALVGARLAQTRPDAIAVLSELSGRIDVDRMRRLNRRLEVDGVPVERVAADALDELGLGAPRAPAARTESGRASLLEYVWQERSRLLSLTLRHLLLVGASLVAGILIAVPLHAARSR